MTTLPTRKPKPLTAAAFTPYGDVIETRPTAQHFAINYGLTERYHDLANIDVLAQGGRPLVSLFHTTPLPPPITIRLLERHPISSQAFMPLSPYPYLVVVAAAGPLHEDQIEVFLAQPGQGVNYHPGTWHHFSLALVQPSDFLVIDRGDSPGQSRPGQSRPGQHVHNCDEQTLHSPFVIDLTL